MADKKNIVIKVKYPTPGKMPENDISAPKMITEWNVKRIVITAAGLVFVLAALFYFLNQDQDRQDTGSTISAVAPPEISAKSPIQPATAVDKQAPRAQLTTGIINNEPVDELSFPLKISKKGSTWIYYFVELKAMKGKTVYHEWLLDGLLISRKKVNISDELWRTSSRQVFKYTSENNWTVRLVDEAGEVLNEKHFNVIYE